MRSAPLLVFIFLVASVCLVPPVLAKRVALVVGNGSYEHATPLKNPRNDAEALATVLKRLKFEVITGIDLTRTALETKVREFSKAARGADTALLFYAGHGLQVNGRNYLAPIDARLTDEDDLEFETVRLETILSPMERSQRTNLVFLDACRDNPLARNLARSMGTRSANVGRGLARVEGGVGTLIAFATQPGNVALDGAGNHSPFAESLLKHIETPNLDIAVLMRNVRQEVLDKTSGKQVPWSNSSLTSSFIFNERKIEAKPAADKNEQKVAVGTYTRNTEPDPKARLEAAERLLELGRDDIDNLRLVAEVEHKIENVGEKSLSDLRSIVRRINEALDVETGEYFSARTQGFLSKRAEELRKNHNAFVKEGYFKFIRAARGMVRLDLIESNDKEYTESFESYRSSYHIEKIVYERIRDREKTPILKLEKPFADAMRKFNRKNGFSHWNEFMSVAAMKKLTDMTRIPNEGSFFPTDGFKELFSPTRIGAKEGENWYTLAKDVGSGKVECQLAAYHVRKDYNIRETEWLAISNGKGRHYRKTILFDFSGSGFIDPTSYDAAFFAKKEGRVSEVEASRYLKDMRDNALLSTSNYDILVDDKLVYHGPRQGVKLIGSNKIPSIMAAFRRGSEAKIKYFSDYTGRIEEVEISLKGFSAAERTMLGHSPCRTPL